MATVRPFATGAASVDIPVAAITALMRNAGETPFIDAMLDFCCASIGADFVSIFSRCSNGRPMLVGTATTTGADNARKASEGYMQHFASDVNFALMSAPGSGDAFVTYQTAADIESLRYRQACYDRTGIADRCSYVRARGAAPLSISLYRSRRNGRFSERELDRIVTLMPILVAAVERHGTMYDAEDTVDAAHALRRRCPTLTPREAEVAAHTRAGLSARQIAEALGIAETTVVSHRKSAYARLGLTGLRQLMRL